MLLHSSMGMDWGQFHPILIHFPIVLFSAALLCDLLNKKGAFYVGHWLIICGALFTLPTIITGFAASGHFPSEDPILSTHKLLGIATGILGNLYALLRVAALYEKWILPKFVYLFLGVALVALLYLTSDYGGLLTRSSTPFSTREIQEAKVFKDSQDLSHFSQKELSLYLQKKLGIEDVLPIFEKTGCVHCHVDQFQDGYPLNFSTGKNPNNIFLPRDDKGMLKDPETSPFYQTVILNNQMPMSHDRRVLGLSFADRLILLQWLNNNAPLSKS